jgi:purine-binding chemotaxis protein CheW
MSLIDFQQLHTRLEKAEEILNREKNLSPEERQKILAARAVALRASHDVEVAERLDVLAFSVGGESYAIRTTDVEQVLPLRGVFPLPNAPKTFLGTMAVRSKIIAVMDLRQVLELQGAGMSDLTIALVVGTGEDVFGIAAQSVEGRMELPKGLLKPPPAGPFLHLAPPKLVVLDIQQLGRLHVT